MWLKSPSASTGPGQLMAEFFPSLHWSNLLIIPSLLIGYTIHELAHALTAYALGDHTQVEQGKITLNPLEHISWLGAFVFIIIGIGWPKNMFINSQNLKKPDRDLFFIAIAGPLASLTLGLIGLLVTLSVAAIVVYSSGSSTDQIFQLFFPTASSNLPETLNTQALAIAFTGHLVTTNFWLTFMSMLPLPGQDGFIAAINLVNLLRKRQQSDTVTPSGHAPTVPPKTIMRPSRLRNNAADIHFKIGVEYHETKQYDDAIVRYRQAISNDQNFGPAYINLGLVYLAKNDRQKAIHAFRGAIKYADDHKSEGEAWRQLHLLSEVNPIDKKQAEVSMQAMGASPWTDTKPRPNWWGLGIGSGLLLISTIVLYGYLLAQLIEMLKI